MNKLKEFFKNYSGLRSSVIICYYVAFLPLIVATVGLIPYLITGKTSVIGLIGWQYNILIWLIPLLFLSLDLYDIITKKHKVAPIKETIKSHTELFILGGFLLWCIIATILQFLIFGSSLAVKSYVYKFNINEGILMLTYYAFIVISAFFIKDKKITKNILLISIITSIVLAFLTLINPSGSFYFHKVHNTPWASFFINSNHYGYYLTIFFSITATLFTLAKKAWLKWLNLFACIIICCVMMFNNTLGCLLSVFAVAILIPIVLSWFKGKFKWKYMVPILVFLCCNVLCKYIAMLCYPSYNSSSFFAQIINLFKDVKVVTQDPTSEVAQYAGTNRWKLWLMAFKEIASSPIIGTGNTRLRPHNEYLQYAQCFGLPALIIYISAFVVILIKTIKYRKNLSSLTTVLLFGVLGYLISAMFGNTMPHTMPFFCLILGFLIRCFGEDIKMVKYTNLKPTDELNLIDEK